MLDGNADLLAGPVTYDTEVTMTGESTFVEKGELVVGDRPMSIDSVGDGVLEPSARAGVLQGAVLWRVEGWSPDGAVRGLLATSFMLEPGTGRSSENQVLRLFVAD
ncbi:hypothetical protein I4I73_29425 [Pseudonocardia sp. KRD-184]|uniref:Allene oxide cyclase barrel-like domain-containing protein n=1 Tax=Pseudonocardia oceani TaxID=2792013 RepID=A0ABS6UCN9_9PSEU|nr:hypothetical protein [Pseudonocardia oceani]MBW0093371.1 hypothetical protein [Pseudonocardia oceani]MBW0100106.1 hypothetical protein [Pseudonocardia oceani]MBW0112785.1 hypothetical protein [Pseudonocardia oceani]MBW0121242.1 hypothetical protein [Pseudonocardia oceani]MBW0129934.1 hypothetical protein [Pseudonocardia oceani]